MDFRESILVALASIRSNLFRSILTTLGIVIGIAAVIAVVAIGQGGRAMLMSEMEKIGSNLFAIYPDWRQDEPRAGNEFALEDVNLIKDQVPEVKYLIPYGRGYESIRGGRRSKYAQVLGTGADMFALRNLEMKEGRFFSPADETGRRRVAAIDEGLARELFNKQSPLGKQVVVNDNAFTIIGVVKQNNSFLMTGGPQAVYIPIRLWISLYPHNFISDLEGSTFRQQDVPLAMEKAVKILEHRHHNPDTYMTASLDQQMEVTNKVTGIMTLIISAIAGISLLVGGIGVMNIMLVSVTERTREIGLRMALGARRRDILVQFLIEAVVLCLIGGCIGMLLGIGGAFLVARIAHWPPLVSWSTVFLAIAFSAGVGILFGLLPANQASRLDPIEALRRD